MVPKVTVVGGGMAGSEAAWQLAEAGLQVALVEMKPCAMSPAHQSPLLGELVCSNSACRGWRWGRDSDAPGRDSQAGREPGGGARQGDDEDRAAGGDTGVGDYTNC